MDDPWTELAKTRIFTRLPGVSRADNRRRLDLEIERLEAILIKAKEARNLENDFVTLPEELILRILLLVQNLPTHNRLPGRTNTCARCSARTSWTGIFSVCRRFSTLSHSTLLYRNISDDAVHPALYHQALARSCDAPLSLTLHYHYDWQEHSTTATRSYIKRNRARITDLELHSFVAGARFTNQFLQRLALFTNLKHLRLINYMPVHLTPEPYIVPLDLAYQPIRNWTCPTSLESLYIDKTPFPWNSPIYDNLLELTLVNISGRSRLTVPIIADLLMRMKQVQTITLKHSEIELAPEGLTEQTYPQLLEDARQLIIPPSSLRRLFIIAPTAIDHAFWLFPPSTSIAYSFTCLAPPEYSPPFAARVLGNNFYTPNEGDTQQLPPLTSLAIMVEDGPTALYARACYSRSADLDSATPDITLHYNVEDEHSIRNFFVSVVTTPSFMRTLLLCESVDQLSLDCACEYTLLDLFHFFRYMPNLRILRLTEDMLPNILPALVQAGVAAENRDDTDSNVVHSPVPKTCIPKLQTLIVRPSQEYGFISSERTVHQLVDLYSIGSGPCPDDNLELILPPALHRQMERFIEQNVLQ